ncbi:MAG: NAD(P)-dependent alcohol dehydrogenase [Deltaproteobacteria bacterium]|nr:NAD(P)-dependent alcohol dehydrogenase [Deltaproteobacteria bacterium]
MKALAVPAFGPVTSLEEVELDPPAASGVRVSIHASSLNQADIKVITGKDGGRFLHAARFPLVPGFDFSGVVEGGEGFDAGTEVFGHLPYARSNRQGTFAELIDVPADSIAAKPASVTHAEAAAAATTGLTALQALRDLGAQREGMKVLINGASGGVGSFAVQIAKLLGASVTAVCSAGKADFVTELGADRVVDYRTQSVLELDHKFDIVFDCAASLSFWKCRRLLESGGTYITTLPSPSAIAGLGLGWVVGRRCKLVIVKSKAADLQQLATWLEAGQLSSPLDKTVSWSRDNLIEALEMLAKGAVRGKIAVNGPAS